MSKDHYTVYFAGELFSFKHLVGNAALADAIHRVSEGKYRCVLPQNLEQREVTPLMIRNQDLNRVATCDVGLYHFDGSDLDSGTVVEFIASKFLDIPTVIIRSDFRKAGDGDEPWNLMASGYPRNKTIVVDCVVPYQRGLAAAHKNAADEIAMGRAAVDAGARALEELAGKIVAGFEEARAMKPQMPSELRGQIYNWFAKAAGGDLDKILTEPEVKKLIESKGKRGLL